MANTPKFVVNEVIKQFKRCSEIPLIVDGRIGTLKDDHIFIMSDWIQSNLEQGTKTRFSNKCVVSVRDNSFKHITSFPPTESPSDSSFSIAPSGIYKMTVITEKKDEGTKQYIHIWNLNNRSHVFDIDQLEVHGKINEDDVFETFQWSKNERKILYTADRYVPKAKSFMKMPLKPDPKDQIRYGEEYLHEEDWGEQLTGKCSPVPCILDLDTCDVLACDFLPENVSFGQNIWNKDGEEIISVGWFHETEKLGLIYCENRRNAIFKINYISKKYEIVGCQDNSVFRPLLSPDKSKLIYYVNQKPGPHKQCSKMEMYDGTKFDIIVDVIQFPLESGFPGLYPTKTLFLDDENVILSSQWRSRVELLAINLKNKNVTRISKDPNVGHWKLLDVKENYILASASSVNIPPHVVLGVIESFDPISVKWVHFDEHSDKYVSDIHWEIIEFIPEIGDAQLNYEGIFVGPSEQKNNMPLIVWPHGGPHSAYPAAYFHPLAVFVKMGFCVLMVNYRGSTGFGQASILSLLGKIGDYDVKDVQQAVEHVVVSKSIDKSKINLFGGSHGGFLVTHLIGQYPDYYSACVARNPVVETSCNADMSDIPDWSWMESGIGEEVTERSLITPEVRRIFWEKSPMRYVDNVKVPVLFLVGSEDRRVPLHQTKKYYNALKARNIKTKMRIYKDNHNLAKTPVAVDSIINSILWFLDQ